MSRVRVLCVGELMWDLHAEPGRSLVSARHFHRELGGASANVARHLVERGIACGVGGLVSMDALGDALCEELKSLGIDTRAVQRARGRTGLVFIEHVEVGNEKVVSYRPRHDVAVKRCLVPDTLSPSDDSVLYIAALAPDSDALNAQLEAARRYREVGGRVVLDFNARPRAWRDQAFDTLAQQLVHGADLVKASRGDLKVLGLGESDLKSLLRLGASCVLTDGEGAVQLLSPQGNSRFEPPPLEARTSVGAGDAFDAGMIACLLEVPWPSTIEAWREVLFAGYEVASAHIRHPTTP